jgi:hypothetical protein
MDDMTTFERQLASELDRMAGPGRRIDPMEMVRTVSTTAPGWRLHWVLSATKFVVVGAIVALVGGFVVTALQSQRGREDLPQGAVTPSQTPSRSPGANGPLAGMVVEEVEPGVVRIIDDGAGHNLDERHPTNRYDMDGIAVGADGSVWLQSTYNGSDNEAHPETGFLLWTLGRQGMTEGTPEGDLVALPDGSALIVGDLVTRFDDGTALPDIGPKQRPLGGGASLWIIEPDELMGLIEDGESVGRPAQRLAVIWDGANWLSLADFKHSAHGSWGHCTAGRLGVTCLREPLATVRLYLAGTQINQLAHAPDGAIWAVGNIKNRNGGLYRIALE